MLNEWASLWGTLFCTYINIRWQRPCGHRPQFTSVWVAMGRGSQGFAHGNDLNVELKWNLPEYRREMKIYKWKVYWCLEENSFHEWLTWAQTRDTHSYIQIPWNSINSCKRVQAQSLTSSDFLVTLNTRQFSVGAKDTRCLGVYGYLSSRSSHSVVDLYLNLGFQWLLWELPC